MAKEKYKQGKKTKVCSADPSLFDEARKDMKKLNENGFSRAYLALINVFKNHA